MQASGDGAATLHVPAGAYQTRAHYCSVTNLATVTTSYASMLTHADSQQHGARVPFLMQQCSSSAILHTSSYRLSFDNIATTSGWPVMQPNTQLKMPSLRLSARKILRNHQGIINSSQTLPSRRQWHDSVDTARAIHDSTSALISSEIACACC